eukprot:scaffold699_cov231-Pinguiococcus_pyrenoidosus.AAC.2
MGHGERCAGHTASCHAAKAVLTKKWYFRSMTCLNSSKSSPRGEMSSTTWRTIAWGSNSPRAKSSNDLRIFRSALAPDDWACPGCELASSIPVSSESAASPSRPARRARNRGSDCPALPYFP